MWETAERHIARQALQLIVADELHTPPNWYRDRVYLDQHPFGLPMRPTVLEGTKRNLFLLAYPGYTAPSVSAMTAVVRRSFSYGPDYSPHLRIIYGQETERPSRHRDVFFELGDHLDSYIVGGCKLGYHGEGPQGTQDLENLFHFVANVYALEVERVSIPLLATERARTMLEKAWDDAEMERQAA